MSRKLSIKNYIAIADWMLDLNLNTRELLTYALIYGFSQDGEGYYYGSLEYLSSWLGMSDRTNATRYLKPLVDRGLLAKKEGRSKLNQKVCVYSTIVNNGSIIDNPDIDYIIIQPWMMQDMHLNGKDLLLYALVHGYSRKESGNICRYSKDYFAKWLQCRKDNVDRQIKRAIGSGIIKEQGGGFLAVVPDGIDLPQTDNTLMSDGEIDFTQIDNTFPQSDNTSSLKLTTNNLDQDNLEDNLDLNNNIISNVQYQTKEELSVVVNKSFLSDMDFSIGYSVEAFSYKLEKDFELYQKYRTPAFDISRFMSGYARAAQVDLELFFGNLDEEGKTLYEKGSDLLLKIITNKRFSGREEKLLNLSDIEKTEIYSISSKMFSKDEDKKVSYKKNRSSYLIGAIENIISQNL